MAGASHGQQRRDRGRERGLSSQLRVRRRRNRERKRWHPDDQGKHVNGNTAKPGGAISNYASTLTVTNSEFVGNSAVVGGAICNLTLRELSASRTAPIVRAIRPRAVDRPCKTTGLTVLGGELALRRQRVRGAHITDGGGDLRVARLGMPRCERRSAAAHARRQRRPHSDDGAGRRQCSDRWRPCPRFAPRATRAG